MTFDPINKTPYLPTTKRFPRDTGQFIEEMDKTYIDIANASNDKTIGLYPVTKPAVTGNQYILTPTESFQSLRRVYRFTSTGNIAHGLNFSQIQGFVNIYGTFQAGGNWYSLPHVDLTNVNNQISVTITSSQIQITAGGGAPPSISLGYIVLEYITY